MKYDISDNELIYLYRRNNYEAYKVLVKRYKKRIYGLTEKLMNKNGMSRLDFDDYYSLCYLAFNKCIDNFDDEYIFYSYAMQSMENVINREIFKEKRNEYISLIDTDLINDGYPYNDVVCDCKEEYQTNEVKEYLNNNFDDLSIKIVELKEKGYSCLEIAKKLGYSSKVIYNRLDKIKKGLKKTFYN